MTFSEFVEDCHERPCFPLFLMYLPIFITYLRLWPNYADLLVSFEMNRPYNNVRRQAASVSRCLRQSHEGPAIDIKDQLH